jgi:D-beta-D-heptose 7-phosphate kinase/D-beta-D-heptose 1-phosphate adenosyltransferase
VSLAGRPSLGGVVGHDLQAKKLSEALGRLGVDVIGLVADAERSTTTKTRLIAHSQQVVRMDSEQRNPLSLPVEDNLLRWIDSHVSVADACVISDYGKGVVTDRVAEHVIGAARQMGKPVIVDPKGTNYAKYRGATVVKPNVHEVQQVWRRDIEDEDSLLEASRRLLDLLEGAALLVTRGAEGMSLFRNGFSPLHIATVARRVFDVTGAGDTVVSTLAMALAAGSTLEQAVHVANLAAGIVVGKRGTATVTLDELREGTSLHGPCSESHGHVGDSASAP